MATFDVWLALDRSPPEKVPAMINAFLDVAEHDDGYARFVVLRGLIHYTGEPQRRHYITHRLVNAVAAYAVRVGDEGRIQLALSAVLGEPAPRVGEKLFPDIAPTTEPVVESTPWFDRVIDAEFEVWLDDLHIPLPAFRHWSWRFGRVKLWLDGRLLLDDPNKNYSDTFDVSLAAAYGRDVRKLLGHHVQHMELEVVAPNGMTATAKLDREFDVYDDHRLSPTTQSGQK